MNTSETAAMSFHTDVFTKVYLMTELLSSSCVHDQSVSGKLSVSLEYLIPWKEGNESNFNGKICIVFAPYAIHMLLNCKFLFLNSFLCCLISKINHLNGKSVISRL